MSTLKNQMVTKTSPRRQARLAKVSQRKRVMHHLSRAQNYRQAAIGFLILLGIAPHKVIASRKDCRRREKPVTRNTIQSLHQKYTAHYDSGVLLPPGSLVCIELYWGGLSFGVRQHKGDDILKRTDEPLTFYVNPWAKLYFKCPGGYQVRRCGANQRPIEFGTVNQKTQKAKNLGKAHRQNTFIREVGKKKYGFWKINDNGQDELQMDFELEFKLTSIEALREQQELNQEEYKNLQVTLPERMKLTMQEKKLCEKKIKKAEEDLATSKSNEEAQKRANARKKKVEAKYVAEKARLKAEYDAKIANALAKYNKGLAEAEPKATKMAINEKAKYEKRIKKAEKDLATHKRRLKDAEVRVIRADKPEKGKPDEESDSRQEAESRSSSDATIHLTRRRLVDTSGVHSGTLPLSSRTNELYWAGCWAMGLIPVVFFLYKLISDMMKTRSNSEGLPMHD